MTAKTPSIDLISSWLEFHGEPYARHHLVEHLKKNCPGTHQPSDEFWHAVATNRIEWARIYLRVQRLVGGHPGTWLLRSLPDPAKGDELRNVQNERRVIVNGDTAKVVRILIEEAMAKA